MIEAFLKCVDAVRTGSTHPLTNQLVSIFIGDLPGDSRFSQSPHQMMETDRDGNRDVEALGETVNGDSQDVIRHLADCVRATVLFITKDERRLLCDVKCFEFAIRFMRACHDDREAFGFEAFETLSGVLVIVHFLSGRFVAWSSICIAVQTQPSRRSEFDIAIRGKRIPVLDDMNVLQSEAVATAQAGTRVVRLMNVFNNHSEMPRAIQQDAREQFPLVGCEEAGEIREEGGVTVDRWFHAD